MGGFIAALLARAGEQVLVIARPETAELISREGISVSSVRFGDFVARPEAREELRAPIDFVLVATKATALDAALERIRVAPRLVVPLLNGLDHMATLRARFGAGRVAAGSIRIEADRPRPARVIHTSPLLRIDLAADDPVLRDALTELRDSFVRAQIPAEIWASEAQVLWSKLVRLGPLACITSASDRPIGFVRTDPYWRAILEAAIAEMVAVANADGARIDPAVPMAELEVAHPTLSSSMQRDLAAGRTPELDAIPGSVLRAAQRHGLECATVEELVAQIERRAHGEVSARRS